MKKALTTILKYVIFLGLGIWIIYYMISKLSVQQRTDLVDAIKSINAWWLIPIFVVGFFSHFFRALRWRYLLETIDLRPTIPNTMFAVMIGYLTNLLVPRAGEVAKCTVLAKYEDMPAHKMVGTIVAERAFDILSLLVIALGTFLLEMRRINDYVARLLKPVPAAIARHEKLLLAGLAGFVLLIVVLVIIYRRNRESKAGKLMKEMAYAILSIFHMKKKWQFLGYTILIWLMYVLQIYIGLRCLHDTHDLGMLASLVVLVYGSLALIIIPGGIGAYPLMVQQILAGPYGINEVPALAFGWIAWSVQTVIIVLLGVISLLVIHSYNKKRQAKELTNAQTGVDTAQDT